MGQAFVTTGTGRFLPNLAFLSFVDRGLDSILLIEAHMYTVSLLIIPSDMS